MYLFHNDYNQGCHPKVMEKMIAMQPVQMTSYGQDVCCEAAAEKIRKLCNNDALAVHFLVGGTQTNLTVISAALRPHQAVLGVTTAHINVHETGSIEAVGHKILSLPSPDGKITAEQIEATMQAQLADESAEHVVQVKMVYISNPTELGTLYTKAELTEMYETCRKHGLPLFIDGARLGYGLMSDGTDVTLPDLAALCDVFYIGGTKVGALCGEAVVFPQGKAPKRFLTTVKRHGALLAKGRLLGVQFDTLFTDDLYFRLARHAIRMADKLKTLFREKGYTFYLESPTNQQFVILEDARYKELSHSVRVDFWAKFDASHTIVRFTTSWSTSEEDLLALSSLL